MVSIVRLGVGRETTNRRLWKTTTRDKVKQMTRAASDRRRKPRRRRKKKAAKETVGKMELSDVDEEYYPSDARPAEKGELCSPEHSP